METSIRVERNPSGPKEYWYQVTGWRADLIAAGLANSDWFPQGRKRVSNSEGWGDGKCMFWTIKKHAGDYCELKIWNATEAQRRLLDPLLPTELIVPPTPDEVARKQKAELDRWEVSLEVAWSMASQGKNFRLSERDQDRFLEALRAALAILNTATIVNVEQQQTALGVARRDQTFQQFMLDQGLRDHAAEAAAS